MPDSNTRRLTDAELWEWDRESLSFMFNEIMARHGYVFEEGGQYDTWFRQFSWYTPNQNPDNQTMVYNVLSDLEWLNYQTIRNVASQMDARGEAKHTPGRKCYKEQVHPAVVLPELTPTLYGFGTISVPTGRQWIVYSAPSYSAWRQSDDLMTAGANGAVWVSGWDGGWLQVCYNAGYGSLRVGYISGSAIGISVYGVPTLNYSYVSQMVQAAVPMTNDPMYINTPMTWLRPGDYVVLLTTCDTFQGQRWDYIETTINGQQARGFIPHGVLVNYGS